MEINYVIIRREPHGEVVDTYVWISDNYFVYSIYGKGIYCYDVTNANKITIVEKDYEAFEIKEFKDNVLTYDNKELVLEY